MPCCLWPQECQRKERSCKDVIVPPHPTPPHPTVSEDDALLVVAASVSKEGTQLQGRYCPPSRTYAEQGTQLQGRYCPTPPHPTPCWVWPQVCQREERSCKDVIVPPHPTPPHCIWRRCLVGCGRKCVKGRNAAARTLLSPPPRPTPPHPPHLKRCHVECGCTCAKRRNAAVRMVLSPPTPSPRTWRRCHAECSSTDLGCKVTRILVSESRGFWLRNRRFLVAESSVFGCGIVCFWLRKRIWFWLRNRQNLVAEAPKYGCGIGDYSNWRLRLWCWFKSHALAFCVGHSMTRPSARDSQRSMRNWAMQGQSLMSWIDTFWLPCKQFSPCR